MCKKCVINNPLPLRDSLFRLKGWAGGMLLLVLSFNHSYLTAQIPDQLGVFRSVDSLLNIRGEAYISMPRSQHKSFADLGKFLIADKISRDSSYFYISSRDTAFLRSAAVYFNVLPPPSMVNRIVMASSIPEILSGNAYPSYEQYLEIMKSFQDSYPDILTVDTIGYSISNRLILAARITAGERDPDDRPVVHFSSTMHGDEVPGYSILLMLTHSLMQSYNSSAETSSLLQNIVLIINPLSNPDGTYFTGNHTVFGSKRSNLNNVDLNRNFPDPYAGSNPDGQPTQKENLEMMAYLEKFPPSISVNIHSGAEVINYPWDWRANPNPSDDTPNLHPDDTWFQFVSKEYADTARAGYPSYMSLFPPWGITNGAAWYPVYGGRQDYVTAFVKGRELTLEISNEKTPSISQIPFLYQRNSRSLINFAKQALYGIHGNVRDEQTETPLLATIILDAYDDNWSVVQSDSVNGNFYRYLHAGNYTLIAQKTGYVPETINVSLSNYSQLKLDILLKKDEEFFRENELEIIPNPFRNDFKVRFASEDNALVRIELFTLDGKLAYTLEQNAIIGLNSIDFNSMKQGIYILRFRKGNLHVSRKIISLGKID
jgi:hypothetical protein